VPVLERGGRALEESTQTIEPMPESDPWSSEKTEIAQAPTFHEPPTRRGQIIPPAAARPPNAAPLRAPTPALGAPVRQPTPAFGAITATAAPPVQLRQPTPPPRPPTPAPVRRPTPPPILVGAAGGMPRAPTPPIGTSYPRVPTPPPIPLTKPRHSVPVAPLASQVEDDRTDPFNRDIPIAPTQRIAATGPGRVKMGVVIAVAALTTAAVGASVLVIKMRVLDRGSPTAATEKAPAPAAPVATAPPAPAPAPAPVAAAPTPPPAPEPKPVAEPKPAAEPQPAEPKPVAAAAPPSEPRPALVASPATKPAVAARVEPRPPRPVKTRAIGKSRRLAAADPTPAAEPAPAPAPAEKPAAAEKPAPKEAVAADEPAADAEEIYWLRVRSTPPGAEVLIDGQVEGQTPFQRRIFDTSRPYALTVRKAGYETHEQMLSASDEWAKKGNVRTLNINAKLPKSKTAGDGDKPPATQ
jgi:hypothetical protein